MSLKDDFLQQWQSFYSVVESELIRSSKEADSVSIEKANSAIQHELRKWSNTSQSQGVLLYKLAQTNTDLGSQFKNILVDIKLNKIENIKYPSIFPGAVGIIAAGAIGFFVSKAFVAELWKILGFTLISMFFAGSVFLGLWQDSRAKVKNKLIKEHMEQLSQYRDRLAEICIKAEQ